MKSRFLRDVFVLLLAAAVPATVAAIFHPNRPEWTRTASDEIDTRRAEEWTARVLWVDARPQAQYEEEHIPEAVSLNEDRWNDMLPALMGRLVPEVKVVVYCSSQSCAASHQVARRLRNEVGLDEVYVLKGGWEAWQSSRR